MKSVSFDKLLALMVVFLLFGLSVADLCSKGSKMMEGNSYCQEVKSVKYLNVGKQGGVYKEVIGMDGTGTCETRAKHFAGHLAPFNEELSLHLRGPIAVKQFAAYIPKDSKKEKRGFPDYAHVHLQNAVRHSHIAKRDMVIATIDGLVQSWENNWFGPDATNIPATTLITTGVKVAGDVDTTTTTTALATTTATTCTVSEVKSNKQSVPTLVNTPAVAAADDKIDNSDSKSKNAYSRISYYDSASQTAENVVFLGNHGGQGSGVFDYTFGASLSYVNHEGTSGSPSAQILADTVIPSGNEIAIMTGEKCDKHSCGYSRPGSVSYRGFDGADKVFFLEFGMPYDGRNGFEGDQPAVWFLNAKVPRTQQYGGCSCWPSCGEIDIAECLSVGSHYMKSTIHADAAGGDSDYFNRPVIGTTTIVTIFRKDEIYIGVVANEKFPENLNGSDIDKMIESNTWSESDFSIA
ncbi:target of Sbf [Cadophora gregata]|uniref:target of Sbf n=1 Tax=Cadophora gregata TaxID=51156 RepID=UPI0026DCAE13|nr:target of Sbf [Cadophora gregata]KAK0118145.1 target of Sbf [Cadophora gregata]KAK0123217.1 target of Sbf [Cadophora gregata f. sp. sojae]